MESVFGMREASEINNVLEELPVAELVGLKDTVHDEAVEGFKGVRVTYKGRVSYVNCLTNRYTAVQHKDAFRPIIEGLTQGGVRDFKFVSWATPSKAQLQIYVGGAGYDGVSVGFTINNSYDGSSALSFGMKMNRTVTELEVVGWRQICSNGAKIRVPLGEAEIITIEERSKITALLAEHTRIVHSQKAEEKLKALQYVVEAVSLLRNPVEKMIRKAQAWTWTDSEHLKALIKKHVGLRIQQKVMNRLSEEPNESLWSLFNAMTYIASHNDMRDASREGIIDAAADMLNTELFAKV